MKPAEDAIILDTTALDAEHAFHLALKLVRSRLGWGIGATPWPGTAFRWR